LIQIKNSILHQNLTLGFISELNSEIEAFFIEYFV